MKKSGIALFILYAFGALNSAHAVFIHPTPSPNEPTPWFTGPLLTPSGEVVPYGHFNIEPYEYITTNYGRYDSEWQSHSTPKFYTLRTQVQVQIGLPADFDVIFTPQWAWNHQEGASHWVLNDMPIGIDYQLYRHEKESWWPSIKLALRADLPLGKYQKLNPHALGTDNGGTGSWLPRVGLVFSHLFWWGGHIFFNPRLSIQYFFPIPVHVKGYNTYGGGRHTHGKVYPGQSLMALFGFELSLTQRWAIAGDIEYLHVNKTRFKGHKGITRGISNAVSVHSTESLSLAPAIEYNWSYNYGLIAGAWFTVAGRNSLEFASAVIAFNMYK